MSSQNALGKILVQRGVLSSEALEQALRLKERQGGSLAVNLVITGALDDQSLATFYRERYDVAPIEEAQLLKIDRAVFSLIPVEIIYDTGILPLWVEGEDEDEPTLIVGMIDPSEPQTLEEASFFAAIELKPRLLTIGQMTRHYQRMTGKRWKVDWQTVLARRRIHQARLQAAQAQREAPIELGEIHVKEMIEQAEELDASLDAAFLNEQNNGDLFVQLVSIDGEQVHEEELVELTRVKRAVSSTLNKQDVKAAARPRIAAHRRKGENRHFLDPVSVGVSTAEPPRSRPTPQPSASLPSIIIDTTLMTEEEAEAEIEALVAESISGDAPSTSNDEIPAPQEVPKDTQQPPSIDPISLEPELLQEIKAEPQRSGPTAPLFTVQAKKPGPTAPMAISPEDIAALDGGSEQEPEIAEMNWFDDAIEERIHTLDEILSANPDADPISLNIDPVPTIPPEPEPIVEAEPEPEPEPQPEEVSKDDLELDITVAEPELEEEPEPEPEPELESRSEPSIDASAPSALAGLSFALTEEDAVGPFSTPLQRALDELELATERDQIGVLLMRYLHSRYKRVLMLTIKGPMASVWMSWTGDELHSSHASSPFPISAVPSLSRSFAEGACFLGPLAPLSPDEVATQGAVSVLKEALEGDLPLSAVVCPIAIKGRQILFVICDEGPGEAVTFDRQAIAALKLRTEAAFHRIILLRKRRRY